MTDIFESSILPSKNLSEDTNHEEESGLGNQSTNIVLIVFLKDHQTRKSKVPQELRALNKCLLGQEPEQKSVSS